MHWSQRWEPPFAITAFLLTLAACIAWCLLTRRREASGSGRPAASLA
jgi:hypothetical protein